MPVSASMGGRVRAEDVLAHVEGGLDEMSEDEQAENTALAEGHEELLKAHGYRLVRIAPELALLWRHGRVFWWASAFSGHQLVQDHLRSGRQCRISWEHSWFGLHGHHAGDLRECHAISRAEVIRPARILSISAEKCLLSHRWMDFLAMSWSQTLEESESLKENIVAASQTETVQMCLP